MSTPSNDPRWLDVLADIRKTLRKEQYDTWFRRVRFVSDGGEHVQLIVPNRFYADWMNRKYRRMVEEAVRRVLGFTPSVAFEVNAELADGRSPVATVGLPSPRLNKAFRTDTFVVGGCNRLAQAAARSVVEAPGNTYNPLYIQSDVGMGKTHLLQAVCHHFMELHPGESVAYLSAEEFAGEVVAAWQSETLETLCAKYRAVSLLAMDDVQCLAGRESSQEAFFHVFNELHNQKRQVVLSGNRAPQEIEGLSERLSSRMRWGLIVLLDRPDVETRTAILRRKAAERRLRVPEDVLEYLATSVDTNVRELEAALIRLKGYASLSGKPLTLALARELLTSQPAKSPRVISVPQIQETVAAHFGLKFSDLISKKRSRSVAFPRQIGMYLARQLTNLSLGDIGRLFGGRDHTTVLYACEKIEKRRETDESLAGIVAELARELRSALARGPEGGQ
ncbi:MAG TPA: chromosomal replication initiator protein DnaA [Planctomycetota bacterium]|nr:chromosomal replication initiator protein DnaA [Planctomycetota bacterium]